MVGGGKVDRKNFVIFIYFLFNKFGKKTVNSAKVELLLLATGIIIRKKIPAFEKNKARSK